MVRAKNWRFLLTQMRMKEDNIKGGESCPLIHNKFRFSKGVIMEGRKFVKYDDVKACPYVEKRWVNKDNIDIDHPYQKGDFPRAFCLSQGDWCEYNMGVVEECYIYNKAGE